jgi:hypothetical protein
MEKKKHIIITKISYMRFTAPKASKGEGAIGDCSFLDFEQTVLNKYMLE